MTTTAMTAHNRQPMPRFAGTGGADSVPPPSAMSWGIQLFVFERHRPPEVGQPTNLERIQISAGSLPGAPETILEHVEAGVEDLFRNVQGRDVPD